MPNQRIHRVKWIPAFPPREVQTLKLTLDLQFYQVTAFLVNRLTASRPAQTRMPAEFEYYLHQTGLLSAVIDLKKAAPGFHPQIHLDLNRTFQFRVFGLDQ